MVDVVEGRNAVQSLVAAQEGTSLSESGRNRLSLLKSARFDVRASLSHIPKFCIHLHMHMRT